MKWGLVPPWHKGDPNKLEYETNNCRAEGMLTKRTYKNPLEKGNRCVVLADGWVEWFRSSTPVQSEAIGVVVTGFVASLYWRCCYWSHTHSISVLALALLVSASLYWHWHWSCSVCLYIGIGIVGLVVSQYWHWHYWSRGVSYIDIDIIDLVVSLALALLVSWCLLYWHWHYWSGSVSVLALVILVCHVSILALLVCCVSILSLALLVS